jgi:hypothetical protein
MLSNCYIDIDISVKKDFLHAYPYYACVSKTFRIWGTVGALRSAHHGEYFQPWPGLYGLKIRRILEKKLLANKGSLNNENKRVILFSDVDECQSNVCKHQMCKNTLGGYLCSCRKGYKQASDGSCQGTINVISDWMKNNMINWTLLNEVRRILSWEIKSFLWFLATRPLNCL